jgi:GNAT superfamily N-acetyltransferase
MQKIRVCTPDDIPQVIRLSQQWAEEGVTKGYENVKWTEEKLASRINGYFFVAEQDGGITAYAFGTVKTGGASPVIPQDERYLELYEVYISKAFRGEGLGSELVRALLAKAEGEGVYRATVGSSNRNWREVGDFYERLGFGMWYFQMVK